MHDPVTLLGPQVPPPDSRRISALPPDLLEQVRGRVRFLALLIFVIFGFEPFLYLLVWTVGKVTGIPAAFGNQGFALADLSVAAVSAAL